MARSSTFYGKKFDFIKEDVRKIYDGITSDLAKQARQDMIDTAYSIIDLFYNSYTPSIYERHKMYKGHGNLSRMINREPIYRDKGNSHVATITATAWSMSNDYNWYREDIFDQMWNLGHRGAPFQDLKPTWKPNGEFNKTKYESENPHNVMNLFINDWGKYAKNEINSIEKKYKSKEIKYV